MGGQQGKPGVQVALSNPTVIAGQHISGTVNFILPVSINSLSVIFKLCGKEINSFNEEGKDYRGKVKILNYSSILYTSYNNLVKSGSYSLPFKISIPPTIPGTFEAKNSKFTAKISYFVKAELKEKNNIIAKNKIPVIIKQIINADRISILGSSSAVVRCCDCFIKGETLMDAHLDKNAYLPGEEIHLSVSIDNTRNTVTMKNIQVRLVRQIRLISNLNMTALKKKSLYKKNFKVNIPPGDRLIDDKILNLTIPLVFKRTDLFLSSTTQGRIIQCLYKVEVYTHFGCFMSSGPKIECIFMIYPTEAIMPQASAPEEWNPVEMPEAVMDCILENSSPYAYQPDFD